MSGLQIALLISLFLLGSLTSYISGWHAGVRATKNALLEIARLADLTGDHL